MNTQKRSKVDRRPDGQLSVKEIFYSIQGEGPFAGHPAVFIRTAGCNLQCPFCDTDYTSEAEDMDVETIVVRVAKLFLHSGHPKRDRLVVITGGEPLLQNIRPLVDALLACQVRVQVETNGTQFLPGLPYTDDSFHMVCSPKAGSIHHNLLAVPMTYKYLLRAGAVDPDDGLPTRLQPGGPRPARPLASESLVYVQPMDEDDPIKNADNNRATVESALQYGYRISSQLHKTLRLR